MIIFAINTTGRVGKAIMQKQNEEPESQSNRTFPPGKIQSNNDNISQRSATLEIYMG